MKLITAKAIPWVLLCVLAVASPAFGQQEPGPGPTPGGPNQSPDELLQELGATSPQAEIGRVIGIICPSGQITSQDLQDRCNEVVGAAFEGLVEDTQAALQAMAPEENAAVGSTLVDSSVQQIDRVGQRIESVRAGARGGVSVNLAILGPLPGQGGYGGELVRGLAGTPLRGSGFNTAGDRSYDPFATYLTAQTDGAEGSGGSAAYEVDASRWGFFFSGSLQQAERESTDRESGFDLDGYGFTAGFDRSGARSTYGFSVGIQSEESDLKQNSGAIENESLKASLHASWFPSDTVFVDAIAGVGQGELDQDRVIAYTLLGTTVDQVASGEADFDQRFATFALGWDLGGFDGGVGERAAWQVSPEARVEWLEVDIDGFAEAMSDPTGPGNGLGLVVDAQSFSSLTGNLGFTVVRAVSTSWGVLQPSFSAEYVHEFENGVELLTGRFLGDPTDENYVLRSDEPVEDYGRVGAGLVAVTAGGGSFFLQVQHLVAYDDLDSTSVSLGGRLEF